MGRLKSAAALVIVTAFLALPGSASPVGDATWSLASYRAMSATAPQASPSERLLAVYYASTERFEMLTRLREKYPALLP